MRFSERSAVDDTPSGLALLLEQVAESHPNLVDLTLSNPTRAGLSYAAYGAVEAALGAARPSYDPHPLGLESAREAVAEHWPERRARPGSDHVLLVPSSSEAYDYVFTLLCDAGDQVLAPEPSYPLLTHLARYAGVQLRPYRLAYDGAWHIDLDSVRRAIGPRTRAIVLISPNNPTGSYTTRQELTALAELGLPLISDEVFARYDLRSRPDRLKSAFGASEALTFCIDGLSKSAGLPQLKLGWLAVSGPARLVASALGRLSWIADTYLPVSTPVQRALPQLLARSEAFRAPLLERLRTNWSHLERALSGSAASVLSSEGGWYAVVRLPNLLDEEAWVRALAERGVLVHPGYFYDFEAAAPHVVASLLPEPPHFARGAGALRAEVDRHARE